MSSNFVIQDQLTEVRKGNLMTFIKSRVVSWLILDFPCANLITIFMDQIPVDPPPPPKAWRQSIGAKIKIPSNLQYKSLAQVLS